MTLPATREDCLALDRADPLAARRHAFALPDGLIYLDGNSLGALTHRARTRVAELVEHEWGTGLIRSWNRHGWIDLPATLGARIARLVGAEADEVVVADSTSVNLFKLASAACRMRGARTRIVTESGNFPTDLYVLQGLASLVPGLEVAAVPRHEVERAIDDRTFLVVLTHVHYRTAECWDMRVLTSLAHERGARVLWDLSHSVGAVPLELSAHRADFAIGCGYKYLNGGPGAPAFTYVRRDLQAQVEPVLAGWMGHATPFEFSDEYEPAAGMRRHRCGTPPLVAFAALDGALDAFDGVSMAALREKSVRMTELFIGLVERLGPGTGLRLASPRDPARRGSHVSFSHACGYDFMQALIARDVIGDFRAPDVMRFGFTPLYLRYVDVWDAVVRIGEEAVRIADRAPSCREATLVT
jgi:kynureninase